MASPGFNAQFNINMDLIARFAGLTPSPKEEAFGPDYKEEECLREEIGKRSPRTHKKKSYKT